MAETGSKANPKKRRPSPLTVLKLNVREKEQAVVEAAEVWSKNEQPDDETANALEAACRELREARALLAQTQAPAAGDPRD